MDSVGDSKEKIALILVELIDLVLVVTSNIYVVCSILVTSYYKREPNHFNTDDFLHFDVKIEEVIVELELRHKRVEGVIKIGKLRGKNIVIIQLI